MLKTSVKYVASLETKMDREREAQMDFLYGLWSVAFRNEEMSVGIDKSLAG